MFQFPGFALLKRSIPINQDGLPHSEIHGSTLLCSSPQLIAAWHVLHRHCMPRHPPYALVYFNLEWLARTLQNTKQAHELDFFLASKLLQNHSPCGKQPHIQLLFSYYPQYVKEHPRRSRGIEPQNGPGDQRRPNNIAPLRNHNPRTFIYKTLFRLVALNPLNTRKPVELRGFEPAEHRSATTTPGPPFKRHFSAWGS